MPIDFPAGADRSRHLISRFYNEMWNHFDTGLIPELLVADFRFQGSLGQATKGHAAFAGYVDFVRCAFPDFKNFVEETICEGDRAFARLRYRGTHRGTLFGIAPTGRTVEYAGAAVFRFHDDRIAEAWVLGDRAGLLDQLKAE